MNILALDASTQTSSVALLTEGGRLSELSSQNQRTHSEFLNASIESLLEAAHLSYEEIDLISVSIGPGSFTGIRVAINAAKALSYSLNKPLFYSTSLDILAEQTDDYCLAMINAYKNMVYVAPYKGKIALEDPRAVEIANLENYVKKLDFRPERPVLAIGDGFVSYQNVFSEELRRVFLRSPSLSDYPMASFLLSRTSRLKNNTTTKDWKSILPLYIRASAAEENLKK